MVEIAISLAVIGIALVAIIGVLPIGMNVQKDNREETIINQDATVLMEAIRSGARSPFGSDLTNYVYAITNFPTSFNPSPTTMPPKGYDNSYLTNNERVVGLLSTPEYTANDVIGEPLMNLFNGGISNHVVAYVRSISGSAVEKPPQNNPILQKDSFSYKVFLQNTPVAIDTNNPSLYTTNLTANLHELRLTFLWPLLPSGNTGAGRQPFRTMVSGQIISTNDNGVINYFFQPQIFTNVPAS